MALFPLFSRRERAATEGTPDVFVYDAVDRRVRIQVVQIVDETAGETWGVADAIWEAVRDIMRKELGVFSLARNEEYAREEVVTWFLNENDVMNVVDAIEMFALGIDRLARGRVDNEKCDAALSEMTARLREAGIGYEIVDARVVKVNSQLLHAEAVVPALHLLSAPGYEAADAEFRKAHQHYREGRLTDSIRDCGNAMESVLKVICQRRGWTSKGATAKPLLDAVLANGLIPEYLSGQFGGLRSTLESGVPTVRNKNGAHGGGTTPVIVSDHLAAYQLHQTAAVLLFLMRAEASFVGEEPSTSCTVAGTAG